MISRGWELVGDYRDFVRKEVVGKLFGIGSELVWNWFESGWELNRYRFLMVEHCWELTENCC